VFSKSGEGNFSEGVPQASSVNRTSANNKNQCCWGMEKGRPQGGSWKRRTIKECFVDEGGREKWYQKFGR